MLLLKQKVLTKCSSGVKAFFTLWLCVLQHHRKVAINIPTTLSSACPNIEQVQKVYTWRISIS